jgi:hypothetical protein
MQVKQPFKHERKALQAGGTLAFNIPVYNGYTIDNLYIIGYKGSAIATRAEMLADIGNVQLDLGSNQSCDTALSTIDLYMKSLGVKITQGNAKAIYDLNIGKFMYDNVGNQNFFSWGDVGLSGIQLQITAAETLSALTHIEVYTVRRKFSSQFKSYIKIKDYPQSFKSTGEDYVNNLPLDQDSTLLVAMVDPKEGAITHGELTINGDNVFEKIPTEVNAYMQQTREFAQPAKLFNYNLCDGSAASGFPMAGVNDMALRNTFDTAPTSGYTITLVSIKNTPADIIGMIGQ